MHKNKNPQGGPAFEKPAAGTLRTDADVARWAWDITVRMDAPTDPACCDRSNPQVQLACFMVASTIIGADEHRLGEILGIDNTRVTKWAANLRRNGLWLQDGTVDCRDWFDPESGGMGFDLDSLVAAGLIQRTVDPVRGPTYKAVVGRHISEAN